MAIATRVKDVLHSNIIASQNITARLIQKNAHFHNPSSTTDTDTEYQMHILKRNKNTSTKLVNPTSNQTNVQLRLLNNIFLLFTNYLRLYLVHILQVRILTQNNPINVFLFLLSFSVSSQKLKKR